MAYHKQAYNKSMSDTSMPFGFLLYDAARLFRRTIDRRAREFGLTRAQWQVLLYLSKREGSRQTDLADMLEIEPITLVRLLDRLEAAGWIERQADPHDRRVRRLYLRDAAKPTLEKMQKVGLETREIALSGLNGKQQEQLVALLGQVRANLSDREPSLLVEKSMKAKKVHHG